MRAWQTAEEAAANCDVFISIGTSSLVYPAAGLAQLAKHNGAKIIEINPYPTPKLYQYQRKLTAHRRRYHHLGKKLF